MSDAYIHIIPAEVDAAPDRQKNESAAAYFRSIAPQADEISNSISDRLEFVHCSDNFEKICCPSCGNEIETALWQDWMEQDCGENGFALIKHSMPCCDAQCTLHDLVYEWPQGFARSGICAMNANIGKLSEKQRSQFEAILGYPVHVIYQHI